jgi:hypothetical protein
VPDVKYGEELCAWVTLRPGAAELTAEQVREFATGRLAHYKIPRYVLVVEEFPMTVTGKVRKVEMREKSVQLLDLGRRPGSATPDTAPSPQPLRTSGRRRGGHRGARGAWAIARTGGRPACRPVGRLRGGPPAV